MKPPTKKPTILRAEKKEVTKPEPSQAGKGKKGGIPVIDGAVAVMCSFDKLERVDSLKPNPRNTKTHPARQIDLFAKVIRAQGIRRCVTVSTRSGLVVGGHGLIMTAQKMGLTQLPVDYQDFKSEALELAHMAADNEIADMGKIDRAKMKELAEYLDTGEIDMELLGIPAADLERMMVALGPKEKPQIPFSTFLGEENQYVVLVFTSEMDWLAAKHHFGLKTVAAKGSRGVEIKRGIGRVIHGGAYLNEINERIEDAKK